MGNEQKAPERLGQCDTPVQDGPVQAGPMQPGEQAPPHDREQMRPAESTQQEIDGLQGKKPEELTPDELRLMADTMPGEGPGD